MLLIEPPGGALLPNEDALPATQRRFNRSPGLRDTGPMNNTAWPAALAGWTLAAALCACSGDDATSGGAAGASGQSSGDPGGTAGRSARAGAGGSGSGGRAAAAGAGAGAGTRGDSAAAEVAARLGRNHFLIGMGNDLAADHDEDGAYTLGVTLDLHYAYLVGLGGMGGWPDWNADGSFVNILTDTAERHGVVPMFTLYSMAAWGEANLDALTNDDYMRPYWDGAKLLFERLALYGKPAIVHFEPDFWAFAQHQQGADPSAIDVHVSALAPDCAQQPDDLIGMGGCLVALARKYAPNAVVGFHASGWADPDPAAIVRYLSRIGASEADIVVIDMLDRDAGCFEAHVDDACQRDDGPWYWDETNRTSPNFRDHLTWAHAISEGVGKPILWWQLPFGVPSTMPGGTAGHYRDNRVKYLFEHLDEFVQAGGVGAVFGTGAGNQTYITTDGGQFRDAVTRYFAAPTEL